MKENGTQTTSLQRFFERSLNFYVRAQIIEGESWYVAKDVCTALGITHYRESVSKLDKTEKRLVSVNTPGGKQKMNMINHSGVYKIAFGSRKPEAKLFYDFIRNNMETGIKKDAL